MSLNNTSITPSSENYNYRSYFETLLTYGSDAASSHLKNSYWYLDNGNVLTCDPTDTLLIRQTGVSLHAGTSINRAS
jgi:hypothetical protein